MTNKGVVYTIIGGLSVICGITVLSALAAADTNATRSIRNSLSNDNEDYRRLNEEKSRAEDKLDILNKFVNEENTVINSKIEEWKVAADYNKMISNARSEAGRKLADFKESIGYADELKSIDSELNSQIEKVKERIGYDDKLTAQNKLIKDANRAYDTAVFFMEENSAANAAKKAARKAKDKTVDTANEAIEELNKTLAKEIKSVKKDAKDKKEALEERVKAKQVELNAELERKTESLNKALSEARVKIIFDTENSRSEEFKDLLNSKPSLQSAIARCEDGLKKCYQDVYGLLSSSDKLALYLKEYNISPIAVVVVGSFAGLPIAVLGYEYAMGLVNVIHKMK